MCSGFQVSKDTGRIIRQAEKDRRVIRHQWAGPICSETPCHKVEHSQVQVPSPELCPPSLRSTWTLKGRSVTDDILASAREQLHLPIPRVSIHYTGQREQLSTDCSAHMWHSNVQGNRCCWQTSKRLRDAACPVVLHSHYKTYYQFSYYDTLSSVCCMKTYSNSKFIYTFSFIYVWIHLFTNTRMSCVSSSCCFVLC